MHPRLAELERCIRFDPGGRGLASWSGEGSPLLEGGVAKAVRLLQGMQGTIVLVSGFAILSADPPAAETDGPLGALVLGRTLHELGKRVAFLTDELAKPLFRTGIPRMFWGPGPRIGLSVMGRDHACDGAVLAERFQSDDAQEAPGGLVAIERVGPNFDPNAPGGDPPSAAFAEAFRRGVPEAHWGRPHNMRGLPIDHLTAPLHRLFEAPRERRVPTIGVGDGGNEIGMGCVPAEIAAAAVANGMGIRIACRTKCDAAVLAGVSNWGAYAMALGLAAECGDSRAADAATNPQTVADLLASLVEEAGAVDGTTGKPTRTVDGLPWECEADMLRALRRIVGLE